MGRWQYHFPICTVAWWQTSLGGRRRQKADCSKKIGTKRARMNLRIGVVLKPTPAKLPWLRRISTMTGTVRLINIEMAPFFEFDRHINTLQRYCIPAIAERRPVCKTALTFTSKSKHEAEKGKQRIKMDRNYVKIRDNACKVVIKELF